MQGGTAGAISTRQNSPKTTIGGGPALLNSIDPVRIARKLARERSKQFVGNGSE